MAPTPRSEEEVGILHRISGTDVETKIKRFKGFVKQRFSDFHVHEIDHHGVLVNLNSFKLPSESEQTEITGDDKEVEVDETLRDWLSTAIVDEIRKLQLADEESADIKLGINVTSADKPTRTKIHRWIGMFDNLKSETVDKDGEKYIHVSIKPRKGKYNVERRPHDRAKFTHCVLYKQGIDTFDAINFLCRKLRFSSRHITFAGTKDKQAKTVQRICFSNIDAKRLLELNQCSTNSKLGNFSYQDSPLHLGQLQGNHFKILIRDVQAESHETISLAIDSFSKNGFINYFGLQRFGSFKTSTHLVGKALLQMDWLKAFDLILEPNEARDRHFMKKAKKLWLENRDPKKAVRELPQHHMSIEATLIFGLSKFYSTSDFWSAFCTLPRNTRTLYFHSYQSYLWNHLASYRIQRYGLQPVVGDLVFLDASSEALLMDSAEMVMDEMQFSNQDNFKTAELGKSEESAGSNTNEAKLKVLTEEDLGSYTIFDVIIPIEGSRIRIPETCNLKPFWNQLLTDNEVTEGFSNFRPRSEIPKGSYRKVVVLPGNVNHEIIPYNECENLDEFIPSDYDLMLDKPKVSLRNNSLLEKDKTCVIVEFSLPSSSYATMALREILETEAEHSSVDSGESSLQDGSGKRKMGGNGSEDAADVVLSKKVKECEDAGNNELSDADAMLVTTQLAGRNTS